MPQPQPICLQHNAEHPPREPLYQKILHALDNGQQEQLKLMMQEFREKKRALKAEKLELDNDETTSDSECDSERTLELKDVMTAIVCKAQQLLEQSNIGTNDIHIELHLLQNEVLWRHLSGQADSLQEYANRLE